MKSAHTWTLLLSLTLLAGCTSSQKMRSDANYVELKHIRGEERTCLATCVDMVLDYYGYEIYFARQPNGVSPSNLLAMDSLLRQISLTFQDEQHKLHSFVLQADEDFLDEQLARKRPVIMIIKSGSHLYHSVVATGFTADHRAIYIHDPAKRSGKWVNRAKLLRKWQTTSNTAMLIAIAPAGT